MSSFRSHMDMALAEARAAAARGEVPVGAVIVAPDGRIVACEGNRTRQLTDPTAHAELLARGGKYAQLYRNQFAVAGAS
jgi:cytidine deaminase